MSGWLGECELISDENPLGIEDALCAGDLVCYTGQEPWVVGYENAPDPIRPFCDCSFYYGKRDGPDCGRVENAHLVSTFIVCFMYMGITGAVVLSQIKDAWTLYTFDRFRKFSSLTTTFLALLFGSFCMFFAGLFNLYAALPSTTLEPVSGRKQDKFSPDEVRATFFFTLAQGGNIVAVLNIGLVWLEVAQNTIKLSKRAKANLSRYRWVLLVTGIGYVFSSLLVIILSAPVIFALLIGVAVIAFVICTFSYGARRMGLLLRASISTVESSRKHTSGAVNKSGALSSRAREALARIRQTQIGVVVSLSLGAWCGVSYAGLGSMTGGYRARVGPNSTVTYYLLSFRLMELFVSICMAIVYNYVRTSLEYKYGAKSKTSANKRAAEYTERSATGTGGAAVGSSGGNSNKVVTASSPGPGTFEQANPSIGGESAAVSESA